MGMVGLFGMEEKIKELSILLAIIRQYDPELYRHLVGMIRVLANKQISKKSGTSTRTT